MKVELSAIDKIKQHIKITSARSVNIILCAGHQPFKDPRVFWQASCGHQMDVFVCIGLHSDPNLPDFSHRMISSNIVEISIKLRSPFISKIEKQIDFSWNEMKTPELTEQLLKNYDFVASKLKTERSIHFKSIVNHFFDSARILSYVVSHFSNVSNIVAADLDSLLPAIAIKSIKNCRVIYDAHEIWPECSHEFTKEETTFWRDYEKHLADKCDARFIASPGSAIYVTSLYNTKFESLPNCEAKNNLMLDLDRYKIENSSEQEPVKFLFQGGVGPTRGVHLLIKAWRLVKSNSHLIIRGPCMNFEYLFELKKAAGDLLDKTIFFPPLVTERELVIEASKADVGLIPYEPIGNNNTFCCPNKLSQYLAAGLPILSNNLPFVAEVVGNGNLGRVVDHEDTVLLAQTIDFLSENHQQRKLFGENASKYFNETFHWEMQAQKFYKELEVGSKNQKPVDSQFSIDFELISITQPLMNISSKRHFLYKYLPRPLYYLLRFVYRCFISFRNKI